MTERELRNYVISLQAEREFLLRRIDALQAMVALQRRALEISEPARITYSAPESEAVQ